MRKAEEERKKEEEGSTFFQISFLISNKRKQDEIALLDERLIMK
jgi:hypothetical protein